MDPQVLIVFAAFSAFAVLGAVLDLKTRKIPNWLNAAFLVVGLAIVPILFGWQPLLSHLAHFAIALAVAILLFAFRMWGGGDAKFYAAMAAWFPLSGILGLFISVAFSGLVLVIAWVAMKRIKGTKLQRGQKELPYGVAIAAGGILMQLGSPEINFFLG